MDAHDILQELELSGKRRKLTVFLRIDGPGSSLDLRLWQQTFSSISGKSPTQEGEECAFWSRNLPRTVGICIDVGIEIFAQPIERGKLCVESVDYGFCYTFDKDLIPPIKENWLLRIMKVFDLDGVKFTIQNKHPALKSAGLGGSAAVTTGVCLLANELSGRPFSKTQLIGMASMMEQDFGISLTGTQEQSCVMYGGIRDYIWHPFGIPGEENFYGSSTRMELLSPSDYAELEKRMDVYFCIQRHSSDVNVKWREELQRKAGFLLHSKKPILAYKYREAIRTKNWTALSEPIEEYRKIRTQLCNDYMSSAAWKIYEECQNYNAVCFPLGGGGGSVMVYAANPEDLIALRSRLTPHFKLIPYNVSSKGHVLETVDLPIKN